MTTSERRKFALEGASVVFEEFLQQGKKTLFGIFRVIFML
jgi:hypothetical protein